AGYQSFKLARLRGMHDGDAKPSCQVTRRLPEKGSHERLVVRLLRRHRMPQVPPARSADDEIHFADEPAHGLGTDQFPAQGRAHGTGGSSLQTLAEWRASQGPERPSAKPRTFP